MIKTRGNRAQIVVPFVLVITLGSSCWNRPTDTPPPENKNSTQSSPSPTVDESKSTDAATQPVVESDPALTEHEAWILSIEKIVNLTRKGSNTVDAIKLGTYFNLGDLLEVAPDSSATALCKNGTCVLGNGNYHSCCTVPCQNQVSMIRREDAGEMPIIFRSDLPPGEQERLAIAEKGLRELKLGPVTTQFLITTLYTNWRIKEANQELDKLSIQIANPEAKQELQQLYTPALTRTGNMHLKYNRVDDAKKMYQLTLDRSSVVDDDPRARAAAHIGLAQTDEIKGDKTKAVNNLENAKQIYVKQGDQNAAAATDKQIEKTRIRNIDTIKTTRPLVQRSPQP